MRAGKIFINDLAELDLLEKVKMVKITLCVLLSIFRAFALIWTNIILDSFVDTVR